MNKFIGAFSILFLTFNPFLAQDTLSFEEKMKLTSSTEQYSWFYKNAFMDWKLTAGSEYLIIPTKIYTFAEGYNLQNIVHYTDNGTLFTILGITAEPRLNLMNFNKSSVFVKSPVSFNISVQSKGDYPNKDEGVFHVTLPILIGTSFGLNSNYYNIDKNGFAISFGYQLLMGPLAGGGSNISEIRDLRGEEDFYTRKKWTMPIVQLDYYQLNRKNKMNGYSLAFSPYKELYFKLAWCFGYSKK